MDITVGISKIQFYISDFSILNFAIWEISISDFWFLISDFWFLISDFKYRINYGLKIRYSIFINQKSELDYFHFVLFWILESGKQVGLKASWFKASRETKTNCKRALFFICRAKRQCRLSVRGQGYLTKTLQTMEQDRGLQISGEWNVSLFLSI